MGDHAHINPNKPTRNRLGRWDNKAWLSDPICTKCNQTKSLSEFAHYNTLRRDGKIHSRWSHICKPCIKLQGAEYRKAHPGALAEWQRRPGNEKKTANYHRKYRRKLRMAILHHYGGNPPHCTCCGEDEITFLTIDHINNDGAEKRRLHLNDMGIFKDLIQRGFPPEVTVLCYNCNMGRQWNDGICPHKSEQNDA